MVSGFKVFLNSSSCFAKSFFAFLPPAMIKSFIARSSSPTLNPAFSAGDSLATLRTLRPAPS